LADAKVLALSDNNFDQLENFIEFEKFVGKSYYTNLLVHVVDKMKSSMHQLAMGQNAENAEEYYGAAGDYKWTQEVLARIDGLVRSQDIRQMLTKNVILGQSGRRD